MKDPQQLRSAADLQFRPVIEELAFLRKTFRDLISAYGATMEAEIASLQGLVKGDAESKKKLPASRAHDLRDMLGILSHVDVKPAKGRRRDLKKIENAVEELRRIVERWS